MVTVWRKKKNKTWLFATLFVCLFFFIKKNIQCLFLGVPLRVKELEFPSLAFTMIESLGTWEEILKLLRIQLCAFSFVAAVLGILLSKLRSLNRGSLKKLPCMYEMHEVVFCKYIRTKAGKKSNESCNCHQYTVYTGGFSLRFLFLSDKNGINTMFCCNQSTSSFVHLEMFFHQPVFQALVM